MHDCYLPPIVYTSTSPTTTLLNLQLSYLPSSRYPLSPNNLCP